MSETVQLTINDKSYDLPVIKGSENEKAIDISKLTKGYYSIIFTENKFSTTKKFIKL